MRVISLTGTGTRASVTSGENPGSVTVIQPGCTGTAGNPVLDVNPGNQVRLHEVCIIREEMK